MVPNSRKIWFIKKMCTEIKSSSITKRCTVQKINKKITKRCKKNLAWSSIVIRIDLRHCWGFWYIGDVHNICTLQRGLLGVEWEPTQEDKRATCRESESYLESKIESHRRSVRLRGGLLLSWIVIKFDFDRFNLWLLPCSSGHNKISKKMSTGK